MSSSQVLPASVDVDEALRALDPAARQDLKGSLKELARGAGSPSSQQEVSDTLAGLAAATSRLRDLAGTLRGQAGNIARGVSDGDAVVQTLAERESEIRRIVASGGATLDALGSRSDDLRSAVAELPPLLDAAQRTLADARPLIAEARPVATDLTRAAAPLAAALRDVPPTVSSANSVLAGLPRLEPAATRFLGTAARVVRLIRPVDGPLGDALRNFYPIARFLSARRDTFAAWFSNTGDLGAGRDAKGHFARFFVGFEPGTATGTKGNFENNSYTRPHDAAHNRPYSGYPRLRPYNPGGAR
jgi:phospholipid/cholesterol/gamma-HCH transport system substrate-binding protein